jgi:hypothetical protein
MGTLFSDKMPLSDCSHTQGNEHKAAMNIARFNERLQNREKLPNRDSTASLFEQTAPSDQADQGEWVEKGIQDVRVAELPQPEGIEGSDDFKKVSQADMEAGIQRLQEMRPAIEDGSGNSSDYWSHIDHQQGLTYEKGYQRIYDAFYGNSAIHICRDGQQIDIVNGRHRIWLAKQMGIQSLPARIVERRSQ